MWETDFTGRESLARRIGDRARPVAIACAVVCVAGAVAYGHPAGAEAADYLTSTGCQEHQAFVDGDASAVAARLPRTYTAVTDPSNGRPLLFARAIRCDGVTLAGTSSPAIMASYGIVVESPDGRGCASGAPVVGSLKGDIPPACNWYTLTWLANDRRIVDWLRDGTHGFPAAYAPDLGFDLGTIDAGLGGAPFHFRAPALARSPFAIDAVTRERPGEIPVRGGYWFDTPAGTVKLAFSTEDLTSGDATGQVTAPLGSEMAALLGGRQASYVPGYSAFAAQRWSHGVYRKQITGPDRHADSFAGSCSVQGTVSFTPPLSATPGSLVYDYDSAGTCSGTLDGHTISDAAVRLRQSGPSDGSCVRAQTVQPGIGTISFVTGEAIRYTLDFTTAATEVDFTLYGERSGTAPGHGSFLTQRTPPDATLKCGGAGNAELPMDMTLSTQSPLVSARAARGSATRVKP